MKYLLMLSMLICISFGCAKKMYNYKTVHGNGYWYYEKYSIRKKGEISKDILSTGDTLCATNKPPYQMFLINPVTNDTTFMVK